MAELVQALYAKSLFEVALSEKLHEKISTELIELKEIFNGNQEYIKLLASPVIGKEDKQKLVEQAFATSVSTPVLNLLKLLIDNGRFNVVINIFDEYQNLYNSYCGIMTITAITAQEIDSELKAKLVDRLCKLTGKDVKLSCVVDKAVIGGIKLRYDNTEIDATIKSRLEELKQNIKQITL